MKKQWLRGLSVMLLAVAVMIAAGIIGSAARADAAPGKVYTDKDGNTFRVVPLGDGRYELWQLVDAQEGSGGETQVSREECKHEHRKWDRGNDQFHWEECLDCGKLMPPEVHAYNQITVKKAATCKENAVLERKCACGRVDEGGSAPKAGDPAEYFAHHQWGEYESDDYTHWQTCTVCGEKSDEGSHTVSNVTVEKEPDCVKAGRVAFDCGICGHHLSNVDVNLSSVEKYPALKQYDALGHDFSGPLKYSGGKKQCTDRKEGTHAATCTRCGIVDTEHPAAHSWAEQTVSNGTCEDENDPVVIEGSCECGATLHLSYTRHHSFVKDSSKDVEPTCIEPGKLNGERCRYCGIFANYDFAEALGHDWYELEDDRIEPTCTELGWTHWFCARCGWEERRGIHFLSPLGHHEFEKYAELGDSSVCLGEASYDMKCKYCDTYDGHGLYTVKKLAHDTYTKTKKDGPVMHGTNPDGTPTLGQSYETEIWCRRCKQKLGTEYKTVWKTLKGTRFQIVPGRKVVLHDVSRNSGATVVTGQMGKDKGTFFEDAIQRALSKEIQDLLKDYDYAEPQR